MVVRRRRFQPAARMSLTSRPAAPSNGAVEAEKSLRKDRKDEAPLPEVTADRSPTRCPFCHDACGPEDARAMVCQQCLSRHHAPCWREGGERCASCGSRRALAPAAPRILLAPAEVALLRKGLSREAVERVVRRLNVSEADAQAALLEAAAQELAGASTPGNTLVRLVAVIFFFIWLIVLAS